jgi:hypothetical protein
MRIAGAFEITIFGARPEKVSGYQGIAYRPTQHPGRFNDHTSGMFDDFGRQDGY